MQETSLSKQLYSATALLGDGNNRVQVLAAKAQLHLITNAVKELEERMQRPDQENE